MSNYSHPEDEFIFITNEEGEKERFRIILTFEHDETGNQYMVVAPEEDEDAQVQGNDDIVEQDVYAFRYEEEGEQLKLFTIEDDDEWDMVEEVLNTFQEDEETE
ncbi:UPF0473 protein [Marinithermofilum abyssi]|uniref:UPF0473 protein GCM10011571_13680 n=1 Tax=Marinithermofilum abyssi TaxID=1571185 RepID=A0A8J2VHC6_9BACL|nr:DUF1292 domain-containing protein [Marinithermofilum abyssi]GGE13493.1 UPF0473 protein [Marinithermofilum abyssi]